MERKTKTVKKIVDPTDSLEFSSSENRNKNVKYPLEKKSKKDAAPVNSKLSSVSGSRPAVQNNVKSTSVSKLNNEPKSVPRNSKPNGPVNTKKTKQNEGLTKTSISKTSTRVPAGTQSPRMKRDADGVQGKNGAKHKFTDVKTNVTVRSPRERQKIVGNHNIVVNSRNTTGNKDIDLIPKKHSRYRTRTLEPDEVKVIQSEKDVNAKGLEILSKTIAKSEAFYVSLEEKFTVPPDKGKSILEPDLDSVSYDDDFESYESDFESFASSSHHDSKSDKSSIHEDCNENLMNGTKNNSILSNVVNTYDETHLDSGNYDLKTTTSDDKAVGLKFELDQDNIPYTFLKTSDLDSAKTMLYSDEGFEENSGGFSSACNSANAKTDYPLEDLSKNLTMDVLKDSKTKSTKRRYYQQRARDLCNLITFDNVEYSLYEINPISYDVFIKTFGKCNVIQRASQTNEDSIDEFTQTEIITKESKWCQYPVDYSNYIISTGNTGKAISRNSSHQFYVESELLEHISNKYVTEIKSIQNPLQIFRNQHLGCTVESANELSNSSGINMDQKYYKKLHKFVEKTGKLMNNFIKHMSSSDLLTSHIVKSKYKFSDKYKVLLNETHTSTNTMKMLNKTITIVSVCSDSASFILTVHPRSVTEGDIFSRTHICLWDCSSSSVNEPIIVLLSLDNITVCKLHGGLNGFVVAGTKDGNLSAWDLEEHDMWHRIIQENEQHPRNASVSVKSVSDESNSDINNFILRSCSFMTLPESLNDHIKPFYGSVVDIIVKKFRRNTDDKDQETNSLTQVCMLQERGLLTIWTVIKSRPVAEKPLDDLLNNFSPSASRAYWSNMKFYKHSEINLRMSFREISILQSSTPESKILKKSSSYREFPLANIKRKNSYKLAITPRGAGDYQEDYSRNKSDLQPHASILQTNIFADWESNLKCFTLKYMYDMNDVGHFLVGCSSGWILHYELRGNASNPQVFICSGSSSSVRSIEICHHNLPYFLVGYENCVDLFSLSNSKPLKSFYSDVSEEKCSKDFEEKLISIEWSKLRPCLFFTLSSRGRLTVWDLLKSDLLPIMCDTLKKDDSIVTSMKLFLDVKQVPNNEYLVLCYSSGTVEKHSLSANLSKSLHNNKELEAVVLGKYMKLL